MRLLESLLVGRLVFCCTTDEIVVYIPWHLLYYVLCKLHCRCRKYFITVATTVHVYLGLRNIYILQFKCFNDVLENNAIKIHRGDVLVVEYTESVRGIVY